MTMRVFTVANESRYVVVRNVPALGVIEDLLKRLSLYGKVCEYRLLDHADDRQAALQFETSNDIDSEFTDVVWVQYETVNNARHAKNRGVQKPFFGSKLQISYAPQFESREDTADKLAKRRQLLLHRAQAGSRPEKKRLVPATAQGESKRTACHSAAEETEFIGPRLPSRSQATAVLASQSGVAPVPTKAQQQQTKRRRI